MGIKDLILVLLNRHGFLLQDAIGLSTHTALAPDHQ
jgi:hypothetical protein